MTKGVTLRQHSSGPSPLAFLCAALLLFTYPCHSSVVINPDRALDLNGTYSDWVIPSEGSAPYQGQICPSLNTSALFEDMKESLSALRNGTSEAIREVGRSVTYALSKLNRCVTTVDPVNNLTCGVSSDDLKKLASFVCWENEFGQIYYVDPSGLRKMVQGIGGVQAILSDCVRTELCRPSIHPWGACGHLTPVDSCYGCRYGTDYFQLSPSMACKVQGICYKDKLRGTTGELGLCDLV